MVWWFPYWRFWVHIQIKFCDFLQNPGANSEYLKKQSPTAPSWNLLNSLSFITNAT
jgi:hypothetical protein